MQGCVRASAVAKDSGMLHAVALALAPEILSDFVLRTYSMLYSAGCFRYNAKL